MKKQILLLATIGLFTMTNISGMEPDRPATYLALDRLAMQTPINWTAIFLFLDSMQGIIDVNSYKTPRGATLLQSAVMDKSLLAAKELLEKYLADPNQSVDIAPLIIACKRQDIALIKLLLSYGADPYIKDLSDKNCFDYARTNIAIQTLLQTYQP